MRILTISLASLILCTAALADRPGPELLQNVHELRNRLENDRARDDAEARGSTIPRRSGGSLGGDSLAAMRGEMRQNLAHISNRFRCLDVDLDLENNEQTNVTVVCGNVTNGSINGSNTRAEGDLTVTTGGAP